MTVNGLYMLRLLLFHGLFRLNSFQSAYASDWLRLEVESFQRIQKNNVRDLKTGHP